MVSQLTRLKGAMTDGLLTALPPLHAVTFEPHDWPSYVPYRLRVGTFHDPSDGAENLPVWAYLHINKKGRTPVTMELGSHMDLGGDDEMNWELYYENIRHDDIDSDEPVHLCAPFSTERCRSDLLAMVKYYFLLAADDDLFQNRDIVFSESFGQSIRAICRRIQKSAVKGAGGRRSSLSEFPKGPFQYETECSTSDSDTDEDASSQISADSSSLSENDYETTPQHASQKAKSRNFRSYRDQNVSENRYNQDSCFSADFPDLWDRGGIIPLEKLNDAFTETSEPALPILSASSREYSGAQTASLEDLLERNETLSLEIDSLRVNLAAKEEKKRKLDLELYGHLSRKRRVPTDYRDLED